MLNATPRQGKSGLHGLGTKGFYLRYRLTEIDLLAMTIQWLNSAATFP